MNKTTLLGALVLIAAAPLAAQQPAHPDSMKHPMMMMGAGHDMEGMGAMMEMMAPMMRSMAFEPAHLLARKDALGLTPQQVTRLTALQEAAKTAHDAAAADAHAHMEALAQAMQAASPDTTQVKLHFQGAHAAMGKAHWAMLTAAAQARGVLTEGQRGRVDGWADAMSEHHPEHR
jgi:LTXXQ motif family protein